MARRVYSDIDSELVLRLANRTDVTAGQRMNFIKDAYLAVAIMFRHKEMQKSSTETIAQSSDSLTPAATDIWFPTFLRNTTDGYIIRQDSQERIERAQLKPTTKPYTYYWYAGVFTFESFADTAKSVKLWYKRKPVDFTANQSSELDELFDLFIILEATAIAFESVRDFDEAAKMREAFGREAQRLKLPIDQAKLNDYRQGFRVRFR